MVEVIELSGDGITFDTTAIPISAEEWKKRGNEAFSKSDYQQAIQCYSTALEQDAKICTLYGNRSAAYWHVKQYHKSLQDAEDAISMNASWSKGYYRKGMALASLKRYREAEESYRKVLDLSPNDSKTRSSMATLIHQMKTLRQKSSSTSTSSMKGFLSKRSTASLYDDREEIIPDTNHVSRASLLLLRKLKRSIVTAGENPSQDEVILDGVFRKLLDKHEFQRLIYPGIPKEKLEQKKSSIPQSLDELLRNPDYGQELETLMPRVESKAESVLENVKSKAALQGDFMDADTEAALRPQILQEAFGREILHMVNRVSSRKHAEAAKCATYPIASPEEAQAAEWDERLPQATTAFFRNLVDREIGFGIVDDFLGHAWTPLLVNDGLRMIKRGMFAKVQNHLLGERQQTGDVVYLEKADCEPAYPALAECIEKLHGLPYELNEKLKASTCVPIQASTLLSVFQSGHERALRRDGCFGEHDNGHKFTCVYFFHSDWKREDGGELNLHVPQTDGTTKVHPIEPLSDRLVIFRSRDIGNSIAKVLADNKSLFHFTFWIHGKDVARDLD